jgi:hypothetical protein
MRAEPARYPCCLRAAALLFSAALLLPAQVVVTGKVVDENSSPVSGARVVFRNATVARPVSAVSDSQGRFQLTLPKPGDYVIYAERPNFFVLEKVPVSVQKDANEVTITLNHLREFAESINVTYSPPVIDPAETTDQKQLNSVEIIEVPYPASHDVRSALPMFSGVVKDNRGLLHFNGGSTDQTNITLDGFNISDPATGQFDARLSIDTVRSLDLESSRFSPDKGRGSAGSLDVKTGMGDDRWRFSTTNFVPGISTRKGLILNKWTPRITVSGPIARGRAWFHNGFDAYYDVDTIDELPAGQDRSRSITTSNLTRFHVNLNPANILTGSYLINYIDANRKGLSFLDPLETTIHERQNFSMGTLKEQMYFSRGALAEFGFSFSRGVTRDNPQGTRTFEISPSGSRGNYFLDLTRHIEREQWLAYFFLPARQMSGQHEFRFGVDLQRTGFEENAGRHDYEVLRADGSMARRVFFVGDGIRRKTNFESALYVQDRWTPRDGLLLELGLRGDWDQIVRDPLVSPRLSLAWSPKMLRDTKIAAGFGVFADALTLETLTRHQDQMSVTTFFSRDGLPVRGPIETGFLVDEHSLRVPRARMWSLSVERKLPLGLYGKLGFLKRKGLKGFTFVNPSPGLQAPTILYSLENQRTDRYDAVDLSLRRTFSGQYEWFGGYTYSRAKSNAVIDYSLENPIFANQAPGPVDWDTPHRFLTWGWAPLPRTILPPGLNSLLRNTTVVYLLEARTGFPFSVVNEEGFLVGRPNERRFPSYFSVNLHLERRFGFLHYQWAWRFGLNNLTNHGNPNVVNNNIDSPLFLTYERGQQRAFTVRLRFLGRR